MKLRLESQEKRLDELFKTVEKVTDDELKSLLSKHLCVRTSGFIETALKSLISDYMSGTSPQPIQQYVTLKLKNVTNLRFEKLSEFLSTFNASWKQQFEIGMTDERRAALNSIINNRNNIAHGENDSISYLSMRDYYLHAKEVVMLLKLIIKK